VPARDPAITNTEVTVPIERGIPFFKKTLSLKQELLKYNPQFSLQQGLKEAID
jgi:hypothetical protein